MKKILILALMALLLPTALWAQYEEETANGVVSLAGREGFSIETKKGDFVFKPYLLVQATGNYNWYDDEGLDPAYNQDNVANSGFAIPYAVLGFTGKAFDKVTFNLSLNAAASGGALLQQAWFDVAFKPQLALRVGKFKTPFSHAYLTTLGESLLPQMPLSLTTSVIMPYSLNAVMPSTQGNPNRLHENKLLVGVSASINVESEYESTNDTRVGLEVAWLHHKLYLAGELYYMNVGFTERQKIDKKYNFLGGYVQGGYFVAPRLQLAARYDFFNRNGMDTNGFLNMPAVGLNYFFRGCNLKLQAMYQFVGRSGHDDQLDRDNDNLGLATHSGTVLLQYSF